METSENVNMHSFVYHFSPYYKPRSVLDAGDTGASRSKSSICAHGVSLQVSEKNFNKYKMAVVPNDMGH